MSNRQSRLSYNERAFSPQRMMNSSSSSMNQQSGPFDDSSSRYQQAFFQLQNDLARDSGFSNNQRNQNDMDSGWYRNEMDGRRDDSGRGGQSGYGSISNQNSSNSSFNLQKTSYSIQDLMALNADLRKQLSERQFDSNYGSSADQYRSDHGSSSQQRSNYESSRQRRSSSRPLNSAWESGKNAFDDRLSSRNERNRDDRRRETGSSRAPPRSSSDRPRSPRRDSKPTTSSAADAKSRVEKFPDIGEPKIKPKFEDIFDLVRKEDSGTSIYTCKICKIDYLPDKNVPTHLAGKKHKYFLKLFEDSLPGKTKFQKEKHLRETSRAERNYEHKPMFEVIISSITQPLVALEYVVEVLDSKVKEQAYQCVLCDKKCDPRTIERHLTSQTHRTNNLSRHFESVAAKLQASRRFNEDLDFRQRILVMITSRIESKFGRSSAFVYEGHDFSDNKVEICESINMKKHVTNEDIPDAEAVLLEGIKLRDPKWESENDPKPPKEPLELPSSVKRKRKVPENVLEDFRSAVEYAKSSMEKKLRDYEKDPDSHPKYKVEWELFWNKKIDEMSRRGEDSTRHNFHDEWCGYFLNRIRKLHEDEVKFKVDQIRRNLGLTKEDIGEKSDNPEPKRNRRDSQERDKPFNDRRGRYAANDDDEGSLDEDFYEKAPRIPKNVLYTKEKKIFSKFLHEVGIDQNKRPKPQPILVERREPVDRTMPTISPPRSKEPTTLITTCRLLTSLEQELGLLAQKVLDLLSKSIAFEREHSKSSTELLFENENLILIETVKEKIIGMQMAHLISQSRSKAAEKAVSEINKLIQQHEVMVSIKKMLKDMGKDDAAPEEIEMLKAMFEKKKDDKGDAGRSKDSSDRGRQMSRRGGNEEGTRRK